MHETQNLSFEAKLKETQEIDTKHILDIFPLIVFVSHKSKLVGEC